MSTLACMRQCTKQTKKDGRVSIDCIFGLWGVSAPDVETAITEALHYFRQYYADGEYSEHLDALWAKR